MSITEPPIESAESALDKAYDLIDEKIKCSGGEDECPRCEAKSLIAYAQSVMGDAGNYTPEMSSVLKVPEATSPTNSECPTCGEVHGCNHKQPVTPLPDCPWSVAQMPKPMPNSSEIRVDDEAVPRHQVNKLFNEIDCRIEHGAESNGHLEYVHKQLKVILGGDNVD